MARKTTHRRHKRGGTAGPITSVSNTQPGNPNLPYSAPTMMNGGRRRRHRMRGGSDGAAPYSSASSYNAYVNGSENSQYNRTFSTSGPYSNVQGNLLIGAQGQNATMAGVPNANSIALIQSAGSRNRRSRRNTKKRRGGFLGQVINRAIVPFGLLGMQQTYRRNKSHSSKSRRRYK
jgi:hypothetical protein